MLVPAPLEGIANPLHSPNPAKAPWYFMGIQELLLHFHPLVGAVVIPGLALAALALLPFFDYFDGKRGGLFPLATRPGAELAGSRHGAAGDAGVDAARRVLDRLDWWRPRGRRSSPTVSSLWR